MLDLWWWRPGSEAEAWCEARRHWLAAPPASAELLLSQVWRRHLLADYCDQPPERLVFTVGDKGKPRLADSQLHFNVAHSGSWHLLLVSDAPCGVDVEPWERSLEKVRRPAVTKRFAEADQLASCSDHDFLRCWTMKEALAKSRGQSVWQVLAEPLERVGDGWRTAEPTSGQLDIGACVSWVANSRSQLRLRLFAPS